MIALLVKRFGVDLGSEDAEWLDVQSRRSPAGTNIESLVRQFRSEIDYVASLSYVYLDDDGEFVALEGEELERFERIEAKGLSDRFRSLLQYGLWTMSPDEESFLHWDTATGRMKAAIEDADVRWLLNSWLSRRILAALQAGDADNNR